MTDPIASFAVARAMREVRKFKPLTQAEEQDLIGAIHAWLDRVRFNRGDIIEDARRGQIGPPAGEPCQS